MNEISIHDIPGFSIGNAQNKENGTGCTVILALNGAVPGVDVRGGAPGTREVALIDPVEMMPEVNALLLAGGSAFGLDAASGVMKYLEEKGIGFETGFGKVPIVPSAVLFDLGYKDPKTRPDLAMGYEASKNAEVKDYKDGCYGAGTGATVGKILGPESSMKSGIGTYCVKVGDLMVGAIVAVNAFGTIYEGITPLAGPHQQGKVLSTEDMLIGGLEASFKGNTTIGSIITNANLTKAEASKVASMSHDGYARAIRPVHTMVDGDTIFTLAKGDVKADINILGTISAMVMEKAIHRAVKSAQDDMLKTFSTLNPKTTP